MEHRTISFIRKHIRAAVAVLSALLLLCGGLAKLSPSLTPPSVLALSRLGSSGSEVRRIQQKLKQLGYYSGSVDGIYGSRTRAAVQAFQKNCGITADGVAGPTTLRYLGIEEATPVRGSDAYLLAKLIAAEARGESYTGQVAVGAVVLNRVAHPSFPDSVAGVIYQKGAFSCVTDANWQVEPTGESQRAARDAMNGWDPSGGAIYYYNPRTATSRWIRTRPVICTIGNHVFCS